MKLNNILKKGISIDNKPDERDLQSAINYYSCEEDKPKNQHELIQYNVDLANYANLQKEVVELRQFSIRLKEMWDIREKEHADQIDSYKNIIEDMMDEHKETEEELEKALKQLELTCDYTRLVSKEGELNTKRTYKIRNSTANLFKQVKKGLLWDNQDITLNELADEAIQIYCQLIIKKLQHE